MMKSVRTSEMLVYSSETTQHYIPEDSKTSNLILVCITSLELIYSMNLELKIT